MPAPEQLQLVMEPAAGLYLDPVIVLDFQVRTNLIEREQSAEIFVGFPFSLGVTINSSRCPTR